MKIEAAKSVKVLQNNNQNQRKYRTPAIRNTIGSSGDSSTSSDDENVNVRSVEKSPEQPLSIIKSTGKTTTDDPARDLVIRLKRDKRERQKALQERQLLKTKEIEAK